MELSCPNCGCGPATPPGRWTQASFSGVELMEELDASLYFVWCGTCLLTGQNANTQDEAYNNWLGGKFVDRS